MEIDAPTFCLTLLGALAVSACGGAERSIPVASGSSAISRTVRSNTQLYVASSSPYFFNAYQLPLVNDEEPFASETGVNEPVALANDFRHLYVGSLDDGVIYTFDLPLLRNTASRSAARGRFVTPFARRHGPALRCGNHRHPFCPGVGDISGLAVTDRYLYVAGQGPAASEVLQYALPLRPSETPSGSITAFPAIDFLSIAAQNRTLYVASTTAGTVTAYTLPITTNQAPEYTLDTARQIDGVTGVAADRRCRHLYVSLWTFGQIYVYKLPYTAGELPTILQEAAQGSGFGIAVGDDHLFVTVDPFKSISAYPLPITSQSQPDANVPFEGSPAGVTIRSRYAGTPCQGAS